eukprot:359594-Chlamydomonas_euryale.AAC.3
MFTTSLFQDMCVVVHPHLDQHGIQHGCSGYMLPVCIGILASFVPAPRKGVNAHLPREQRPRCHDTDTPCSRVAESASLVHVLSGLPCCQACVAVRHAMLSGMPCCQACGAVRHVGNLVEVPHAAPVKLLAQNVHRHMQSAVLAIVTLE